METREHAIAPAGAWSGSSPSARPPTPPPGRVRRAYLKRLSADASEEASPEELFCELSGLFDFAAGRVG